MGRPGYKPQSGFLPSLRIGRHHRRPWAGLGANLNPALSPLPFMGEGSGVRANGRRDDPLYAVNLPSVTQQGAAKLSDLHKPARQKIRRREFRDIHRLTPRQTQITALLLDGYRYAEIANSLFISENTVRYHVYQIYKSLRVRGRRDLLSRLSQPAAELIRLRSEVAPK
jgi:DNA-binding CsgD family transcriptional regulator